MNCTVAGNIELVIATTTPIVSGGFTLEFDFRTAAEETQLAHKITQFLDWVADDLKSGVKQAFSDRRRSSTRWMFLFEWSQRGHMSTSNTFSDDDVSSTPTYEHR